MTPSIATNTTTDPQPRLANVLLAVHMRRRAQGPSDLLLRLRRATARKALGDHAQDRPLARRLDSRIERLERLRRTRIQQDGRAQAA